MIKKCLVFLAMISLIVAVPVIETGCKTAPDSRHVQYATLKAVGDTADGAVALGAHLYQQGTITAAQATQINAFYDQKFQPAYRVAVSAARADLSSVASPDLMNLAAQLAALVDSFQHKTP